MEDAVYDVAQKLFLRGDPEPLGIGDGRFGADEGFAQDVVHVRPGFGRVEGKGDAVGGGGVVKKFFMQRADLRFSDKMQDHFIRLNFEALKQQRDRLSHLYFRDRQVSLRIMNRDLNQD